MSDPLDKKQVVMWAKIGFFLIVTTGRVIKNGLNIDGKISEEALDNYEAAAEKVAERVGKMLR